MEPTTNTAPFVPFERVADAYEAAGACGTAGRCRCSSLSVILAERSLGRRSGLQSGWVGRGAIMRSRKPLYLTDLLHE